MLSSDEIELFERLRGDVSKPAMKKLQATYMAHNPNYTPYCMCNKTKRKILNVEFYQWYDKNRR